MIVSCYVRYIKLVFVLKIKYYFLLREKIIIIWFILEYRILNDILVFFSFVGMVNMLNGKKV